MKKPRREQRMSRRGRGRKTGCRQREKERQHQPFTSPTSTAGTAEGAHAKKQRTNATAIVHREQGVTSHALSHAPQQTTNQKMWRIQIRQS